MRRRIYEFVFLTLLTTMLLGCSVLGIRSGYEQLSYAVIERIEDVEVRQYPARVVAEVSGMQDDNEAFMLLFRYISGQNGLSEKVAMTAPVQIQSQSRKIEMTAPVEVSQSAGGKAGMRFFLPSSYTVENAPKPNDPRIKILGLPEETVAAIRYSGFRSEELFQTKSELLVSKLAGSKWRSTSSPSFLGYDPPFTIPFLRRNEVIVRVEIQ